MITPHEKVYRDLLVKLTCKERKFVHEYLIDGNATRAAKAAGYALTSARQTASENLSKDDIKLTVEAGLEIQRIRAELSADKLVNELMMVASSSISHYRVGNEGHISVEEDAPPGVIHAIASFQRKRIVRQNGDVAYESELKLWDKIAAINLLGKKLRLWIDKIEIENPQDQAYRALLDQVRERQAKGLPPLPEPGKEGD